MYKESIKFNTIMIAISITVILIALLLTGCGRAEMVNRPLCEVIETDISIQVSCVDGTNVNFETKPTATCTLVDANKYNVQIDCNDSVITIDLPKKGKGHKK